MNHYYFLGFFLAIISIAPISSPAQSSIINDLILVADDICDLLPKPSISYGFKSKTHDIFSRFSHSTHKYTFFEKHKDSISLESWDTIDVQSILDTNEKIMGVSGYGGPVFLTTTQDIGPTSASKSMGRVYRTEGSCTQFKEVFISTLIGNATGSVPFERIQGLSVKSAGKGVHYLTLSIQGQSGAPSYYEYYLSTNHGQSFGHTPNGMPFKNLYYTDNQLVGVTQDHVYFLDNQLNIQHEISLPASNLDALKMKNDTMYLFSTDSLFYYSMDYGANWVSDTLPFHSVEAKFMEFDEAFYFQTQNGEVVKMTQPFGTPQRIFPLEKHHSIRKSTALLGVNNEIWYQTRDSLFQTKNGGRTWKVVPFPNEKTPPTGLKTFNHAIIASNDNLYQSTNGKNHTLLEPKNCEIPEFTHFYAHDSTAWYFSQNRGRLEILRQKEGEDWFDCDTIYGHSPSSFFADDKYMYFLNSITSGRIAYLRTSVSGCFDWDTMQINASFLSFGTNKDHLIAFGDTVLFLKDDLKTVIRSNDGGKTWDDGTIVSTYFGVPNAQLFRFGDVAVLATFYGKMWLSYDRGSTWIKSISTLPGNGQYMSYAQMDSFLICRGDFLSQADAQNVYISNDFGAHWYDLKNPNGRSINSSMTRNDGRLYFTTDSFFLSTSDSILDTVFLSSKLVEKLPKTKHWSIQGNPMQTHSAFISNSSNFGQKHFELFDAQGRLILKQTFDGGRFDLLRNNLLAGLYFYRIRSNNYLESSGKLVLE